MGKTPVLIARKDYAAAAGWPNLDLLRTVAVGLVVLNHLGPPLGIRGVAALGHLGVLLFFVHTALVLMMSMERLGLSGTSLYSAFMIRRIFRIYPLSILSTAAIVLLSIPPSSWESQYVWPGWGTLFSNFALLQNVTKSPSINGVLWSLPYEVQMYALLPLLYLWCRRVRSLRVVFAAWLLALALAVGEYFLRGHDTTLEPFFLARYFPCFLGGVLAWRLLNRYPQRLPGWSWPICLAAFVCTYRVLWAIRGYGLTALLHVAQLRGVPPKPWPLYGDFIAEGSLCVLLGMCIPCFRSIRSRWLQKFSQWIARYSYGIYLSHSAAIWLCFGAWYAGSKPLAVLGSLVLTAVVSVAAYHLIENPFIGFGKRLAAGMVRIEWPRTGVQEGAIAGVGPGRQ